MSTTAREIVRAEIRRTIDDAWAPRNEEPLSDWADAYFKLPSTSAEPGPFQTDRIPYLRGILNALGDDAILEVSFAKSSQVAGSTLAEILIAHRIIERPCGILSIWPGEKKLRRWSRTRLEPMIQSMPQLAARIGRITDSGEKRGGRREASDTIDLKEFANGFLMCLTSLSTSDLKSTSAPVLVLEELDEWIIDPDQGDSEELAERAARTFPLRKIYRPSTPTLDGHSRIWKHLERSTWHEYWVPCPHCRNFQTLRWRASDNDGEEEAGDYHLFWEKDGDSQVIPGTTCYRCVHCATLIEERFKMPMLERGEWRPRFPQRRAVGFHINTLYSPLCSWDDVAMKFTTSVGDDEKMKTFDNTWLGLPHKAKTQQVESNVLSQRAEPYGDTTEVPDGVGCLTAGVDVQGDRLEVVVWGWGEHQESWAIAWEQIDGDPGTQRPWDELDAFLLRGWRTQTGAQLRIAAAAVDAHYQSEQVHSFCETRSARRVIPIIGKEGAGRPLLRAPDPRKFKKARNQRRPSHLVGVDSGKALLMSRLRLKLELGKPTPHGYVHFGAHLDSVFYDQLTAEKLTTVYARGIPKRQWVKIPGRNNEVLDCTIYAMAALTYLGPQVVASLGHLAEQVRAMKPDLSPSQTPQRRVHSKVDW